VRVRLTGASKPAAPLKAIDSRLHALAEAENWKSGFPALPPYARVLAWIQAQLDEDHEVTIFRRRTTVDQTETDRWQEVKRASTLAPARAQKHRDRQRNHVPDPHALFDKRVLERLLIDPKPIG
jgi:hypothetical protein